MALRGRQLAEESGSIVARAQAAYSLGNVYLDRRDADRAEPLLDEARGLFTESGDTWNVGLTLNALAWAAEQQGDDAKAERWLREAIRVLKPLQDRGALCESQRGLAEVLIRKGHIDEAERLALEAVETVAPQDLSSQATTAMTLGLVRAAQGRDAEAEALLRESLALIESSGFRGLEGLVVTRLAEFLSAHGREDEAAPYRARLAELAPAAGVALAFASRMDRIA